MRDSELARYARYTAGEGWNAIALDYVAEIEHVATRRAVASEVATLPDAIEYVACYRALASHTHINRVRHRRLADRIAECIASGCFT